MSGLDGFGSEEAKRARQDGISRSFGRDSELVTNNSNNTHLSMCFALRSRSLGIFWISAKCRSRRCSTR